MTRIAFACLALILAAATPGGEAKADPYRWCAEYAGGSAGGGRNCWFMTIEQCRAAVSGVGGTCNINPFYDGKPIVTPDDGVRLQRRSRTRYQY